MKAASAPASGGGHTRTAAVVPSAAADQLPVPTGNTPAARAAATVALRFRHDRQRLKQIKSKEMKVAAKRQMLPEYQAWCDGLLDAGRRVDGRQLEPTGADDVLPSIMVWCLDIGDWTRGLMLASFVLRFSIPMPKHFVRDAATLVLEEIADAALRAQARSEAFPLYVLEAVELLTDGIDMHDEPKAKLFKAIGAELVRAAGEATGDAIVPTIERAVAVLTRAQDKNERVGVKTMLRGLEKAKAAALKNADANPASGVPADANASNETQAGDTAG
ncbi:phage terminase small subunit [Sphingomonas faeni]|uniref:phage terminase small subunit n=1 Tax=Sphingomonas faeni TaxID=185950 RepID=UPI003364E7ED